MASELVADAVRICGPWVPVVVHVAVNTTITGRLPREEAAPV